MSWLKAIAQLRFASLADNKSLELIPNRPGKGLTDFETAPMTPEGIDPHEFLITSRLLLPGRAKGSEPRYVEPLFLLFNPYK